jgi:hypothetical protein
MSNVTNFEAIHMHVCHVCAVSDKWERIQQGVVITDRSQGVVITDRSPSRTLVAAAGYYIIMSLVPQALLRVKQPVAVAAAAAVAACCCGCRSMVCFM